MENGENKDINNAIDLLDDWNGGADARELGSFVHDWLSELDMGKILVHQMPEQMQPYAKAYQAALAAAGLVPVPEYVERLVLNDRGDEIVCGRLDRIYRIIETGELVLGDLKTGEGSLDFVLVEWPVQFAVYGYATLVLSHDRKSWEPMPKLVGIPHPDDEEDDDRDPYCVTIHMPRNDPSRTTVLPVYLEPGAYGMIEAFKVRELRKDLPKTTLGGTTPIPSVETLRWVECYQAMQAMTSEEDAQRIAQEFEDVIDDELGQFGAACYELLDTDTESEDQ
jgi:hypothetical protein